MPTPAELSAAFLSQVPDRAAWEQADRTATESALQAAWHTGRARWPGVPLQAVDFVRLLARRVVAATRPPSLAQALDALHVADLYLACACELHVPEALAAFEQHALSQVPGVLARMNRSPDFASEVQQMLREKLFVGERRRIADYAGSGALPSWTRILAARTALNLLRDRHEQFVHNEDALNLAVAAAGEDPELDLMRAHYKEEFDLALREAFTSLTDEQRELLHLYYVGKLSTPRLGLLYGVNYSTIVRRLQAASAAILDETRRLLTERLQISDPSLHSLIELMRSQLELSFSKVLGKQPAGS